MISPPIIENEAERLTSVYSLAALDTPPEPEFDELVELAAWTCHTPMAALTLLDESRQWFKSSIGLDLTESPRATGFCGHTIAESTTLIVPDTHLDPRFVDNPFVTDAPLLRFYAGVPITVDDGLPVGSLCVLDTRPRQLFSDERRALEIIARQAAAHLQADRLEWTSVDERTGVSSAVAARRWMTCQPRDRARAVIHFRVEGGREGLETVAHRLQAAAPRGAMVARIGDDELIVLLDSVTDTDLFASINDFRSTIDQPHDTTSGTALGLATAAPGDDGADLIDAAARATALEQQLRRG